MSQRSSIATGWAPAIGGAHPILRGSAAAEDADSAGEAARRRVASRGNRGPIQPLTSPLAGLFNNLDGTGLSQLTVAPPDSTGAIGPNNYVEMVNQQIGVYDRTLNLLSSSDNGAFMGAGSSLSVTDPQIQWDAQGGHWLYAALGVATGANMLLFGWSKTSNPTRSDERLVSVRHRRGATCSTTIRSSDTTTTS